ncbi:FkbM family methyltransferase [Methylacidimicrobium sp. B4]|uniref:FkbM family methyltransferase n=1 Tax=Methylacidimicrobium sp. B4 TaxID=2796139 RepID=UPI001A8DC421|nr:FkbM family methyltransferase [Methylacidimicrobium sp. B4]QSR84393.1 FkbM family methyltransferase [Methylacidimicrobium sp. B4]
MAWISYAENFEDVVLRRALADLPLGFYVDVGAGDPVTDSVTKHFYDNGWRGINLEPDPHFWQKLATARPRDINLPVAAGARRGKLPFWQISGSGLSTVREEYALEHRKRLGAVFQPVSVVVRTLDEIVEEHRIDTIHFLKIDCEGAEADALRGFAFQVVRPWIILVEATKPNSQEPSHEEWEPLLLAKDYLFAYFDGLNRFYVAKERSALRERLALPPNVFDEFTAYSQVEELRTLRDQVKQLQRYNEQLQREVDRLHRKREREPLRRIERALRTTFARREETAEGSIQTFTNGTEARPAPPEPSCGPLEVLRLSGIQGLRGRVEEIRRIVVLQLDHIGDFLNRIAASEMLRRSWPNAEITLLCGPWNVPLAQRLGFFQQIIPFAFFPERSGEWRGPNLSAGEQLATLTRSLGEFDLAVDLRTDPDTRFLLSHVPAKLRAGFAAAGADVVLDIALPNGEMSGNEHAPTHRRSSALLLIEAIRAALQDPCSCLPDFLRGTAAVGGMPRLIAVAPGCGDPLRAWPLEHFSRLCTLLTTEHDCPLLLVGGRAEREASEALLRNLSPSRCRNLVGQVSLEEIPSLLASAQVFVGNDSGLGHIAAALGIPTVIVFSGVVDWRMAHPVGNRVSLLHIPISCSPCYATHCPHAKACLTGIEPQAVVQEVLFWLEQEGGAGAKGRPQEAEKVVR